METAFQVTQQFTSSESPERSCKERNRTNLHEEQATLFPLRVRKAENKTSSLGDPVTVLEILTFPHGRDTPARFSRPREILLRPTTQLRQEMTMFSKTGRLVMTLFLFLPLPSSFLTYGDKPQNHLFFSGKRQGT